MAALGNVLWHIPFLGFLSAFGLFIIGGILIVTVIAAPIGTGLWELGKFYLMPFGNRIVNAKDLGTPASTNTAWRVWGWILLVLWLPLGALFAISIAIQCLLLCITIIGIPAAIASANSIPALFNPVGKKCVKREIAEELNRRKANSMIAETLGPEA